MSHAGAGAVQPEPSRHGSLIEESHPLQPLLQTAEQRKIALTACGCPAFAFNVLNMVPKIMLEKWSLVDLAPHKAFALVDGQAQARVLPYGSATDYYQAILGQLEQKHTLLLVPEHIAQHLKKTGYKVDKQHNEYTFSTDEQAHLPGGRHKKLRHGLKQARRLATLEAFDPARLDDYLALNRRWYRQNTELKFRTYDKTSIDWMLQNWQLLQELDPLAKLYGLRRNEDQQLVAFNAACTLTETMWSMYTDRHDREAGINAANRVGRNRIALDFAGHFPHENDGTADTKTIKDGKDRFAIAKITFFKVTA